MNDWIYRTMVYRSAPPHPRKVGAKKMQNSNFINYFNAKSPFPKLYVVSSILIARSNHHK